MNNDKIRQMLNAIGAIAECTMEMYKQLQHQGFNDDQALKLAQTWMAVTFAPRAQPPREEDFE